MPFPARWPPLADFWSDLPTWTRVGPVAVGAALGFGAGLGGALLVGGIVGGPARALPADAPWYEQARVRWPLRLATRLSTVTTFAMMAGVSVVHSALLPVPHPVFVATVLLATSAGNFLGGLPARRWGAGPTAPVGRRLRDRLVMICGFYPHLLALPVLVGLAHPSFDRVTLVVVGAGLGVLVLAVRGDHLDLLRWIGWVRAAPPVLREAMERARAAAGHGPVEVDELCTGAGNAAAFPLGGRVFATTGLLEALTPAQLAAVLSHELAHLGEGRAVIAARLVAAVAFYLPLLLVRPVAGTGGAFVVLAMMFVSLGVVIVANRQARRMEERADAAATRDEAESGDFARALEAIYRLNQVPAVGAGRAGVHPHLYDRLLAAGITPDYPRPAPPARHRLVLAHLALFTFLFAGMMGWVVVHDFAAEGRGEAAAVRRIGLGLGRPWDLTEVAEARFEAGDAASSARLYAAAAERSPGSPWEPANLAIVLASMGRCEDAARAARVARSPAESLPPGTQPARVFGDPAPLLRQVNRAVATCFAAEGPPPESPNGP